MIRSVRILNFKCLRDVALPLQPLTVLIGKNDTGKSSILQAIALACRISQAQGPTGVEEEIADAAVFAGLLSRQAQPSGRLEFEFEVSTGPSEAETARLGFSIDHPPSARVRISHQRLSLAGKTWEDQGGCTIGRSTWLLGSQNAWDRVRPSLVCGPVYQLDPHALAQPTPQERGLAPALGTSGYGLPAFLVYLAVNAPERMLEIRRLLQEKSLVADFEIRTIAKTVQKSFPIGMEGTRTEFLDTLEFRLKSGARVSAGHLSDGLLYYLGFLSILRAKTPPAVIAIEEPENGMHPGRLREIVDLIRATLKDFPQTRVIMTTHSPYLLDYLQPEEVWVTRRGDSGDTSLHQVSQMPGLDKLLGAFRLGELWTSVGEDKFAEGFPDD